MDWGAILNWNGYGLLGLIASVVGAGLTILFSFRAARSAKSAEEAAGQAADHARKTLHLTNTISELQNLENIFRNLKSEMENSKWSICAKGCSDAHIIAGRIKSQSELEFSKDEKDLIKYIHSQSIKLETVFRNAQINNDLENRDKTQILLTGLSSKSAELSVSMKGKTNVVTGNK